MQNKLTSRANGPLSETRGHFIGGIIRRCSQMLKFDEECTGTYVGGHGSVLQAMILESGLKAWMHMSSDTGDREI